MMKVTVMKDGSLAGVKPDTVGSMALRAMRDDRLGEIQLETKVA